MAKLVLFHFFRTWQPLLDVHLAVDAPLPLPPLARLLQLKERACATMGLRVLLTANAYKLTHNCWGTIQLKIANIVKTLVNIFAPIS